MTVLEIAQTAARLSENSHCIINSRFDLSQKRLAEFWQVSRDQQQLWFQELRPFEHAPPMADADQPDNVSPRVVSVAVEVFTVEMLTRVGCAILTASDDRRQVNTAGPVANNIMSGILRARNLALSALIRCCERSPNEVSVADGIRRRAERWTDMLLGHLAARCDLGEFAFEQQRALDFAQSQFSSDNITTNRIVWGLTLTGIQKSFRTSDSVVLPHPNQVQKVTQAALAMLSTSEFDPDSRLEFHQDIRNPKTSSGVPLATDDQSPIALARLFNTSSKDVPRASAHQPIRFAELRRRFPDSH